ncbi:MULTISPECIES: DNA internalization-related competence protein ComEC/Rec2 [unclassified Janthinobacterium]|uniref:DNA internalization-related competence protein ComEC/Rec2 n=1 Tax=unclassified Janthinobacterium TaxID=2610881 RepID=UPI00161E3D5F|nr:MULTISPECIES: DNA internalization-related competence protein ComEC/Rec2 [unclassified Janthinobacterium]MBB5368542.1 competence protein ComEC [Janthinobacterium sp. K2C7]MBB5381922.1 competence protein ComEC [Janthinobacterium sp. K2Li3]MBB5386924.1 competence protein ComEC [Janthinobacterium sp. K2E3]
MPTFILGFAAGAYWLQTQAALPAHAGTTLAVACLVCLLAGYVLRHQHALLRLLSGCAGGVILGFFWAAWLAQLALAPQLALADEGRDITVTGTIASLPYHFEQGVRFNFAVEKAVGAQVSPLIALSWYKGFRDEVTNEVGDVQPGERWQLTVRLQRPHGNANPMGFDYEVWLLEQGVRATGYVRPQPRADTPNVRLDGFVVSFGNVVEACRAALRARIERSLVSKPYAGVIVALVVGDQRAIPQSDWQVFNRTGVSHLISISGLHITMIAGLVALAAGALWRRSFFTGWQLPLLLPAQKVAALAGAVAALLYVLLAGFGVPAQRTLYMLMVVAIALWTGRITSVFHVLCLALGVVVLLDPWAVLWPGFWLSFGAVATILYASVGRISAPVAPDASRWQRLRAELALGAHTQYVVTVGLVPLTMLLFSQVSLVSPIANALAIPVVSLVVAPLSLSASLLPAPLSDWLLLLAHFIVQLLVQLLEWLSIGPFAVWTAPAPPWWSFAWALFGTLWLLAPRGWPHRWLGMLSWLPLMTALPASPAPGQLWVTAFDVGQGMALLVETHGHRLLYDTGPAYGVDSDGASRVIVPYLRARGIAKLDGLIISHSDADHAGGAVSLLENIPVGWLASSLAGGHPAVVAQHKLGKPYLHCAAGQSWQWEGVRFEMLHPLAASHDDMSLKPNARSCTVKITAGKHAILLAGDIEAAQEAQLRARLGSDLAADVLLAPHHGSGTSSTPAFLNAVHPSLAIFQVGHRNRYKHPKAQIYARYGELGITRLRTDEAGALTLEFGETVTVTGYRASHPRYWYGR